MLTSTNARRSPASARVHVHGGPHWRQGRERVQRCERLYLIAVDITAMFAEYIQAARDLATYEIIDDPELFYGEVPELQGVWAAGKTLEECRKNLMDALEDWIAAHLAWGYPMPDDAPTSLHLMKPKWHQNPQQQLHKQHLRQENAL